MNAKALTVVRQTFQKPLVHLEPTALNAYRVWYSNNSFEYCKRLAQRSVLNYSRTFGNLGDALLQLVRIFFAPHQLLVQKLQKIHCYFLLLAH